MEIVEIGNMQIRLVKGDEIFLQGGAVHETFVIMHEGRAYRSHVPYADIDHKNPLVDVSLEGMENDPFYSNYSEAKYMA
ncbi:MAG: hypothetical protein JXC85_04205 [Candidatus Aenigmarchaeota archaeon]|nr:hypothetical protein [Candidatus Aenigmarchaeota archaeon]